jgi:hypothetical protein
MVARGVQRIGTFQIRVNIPAAIVSPRLRLSSWQLNDLAVVPLLRLRRYNRRAADDIAGP